VSGQEQDVVVGEPGETERIWLIHETPFAFAEMEKMSGNPRDATGTQC
jgi:hypothetical protein